MPTTHTIWSPPSSKTSEGIHLTTKGLILNFSKKFTDKENITLTYLYITLPEKTATSVKIGFIFSQQKLPLKTNPIVMKNRRQYTWNTYCKENNLDPAKFILGSYMPEKTTDLELGTIYYITINTRG